MPYRFSCPPITARVLKPTSMARRIVQLVARQVHDSLLTAQQPSLSVCKELVKKMYGARAGWDAALGATVNLKGLSALPMLRLPNTKTESADRDTLGKEASSEKARWP